MANVDKSVQPVQGTGGAHTTPFDKMSKSQLIEILNGRIMQPLTPEDLRRCAVSSVLIWCDDILHQEYNTLSTLTEKLYALAALFIGR